MSSEAALSDAGLEFPEINLEKPSLEWVQRRIQGWFKPEAHGEHMFEIENPTSIDELDHERTRRALMNLVFSFKTQGLSFDDRFDYTANSASAEAAVAFTRQLSAEYQLPRVAPDDEGDIIMVWEADTTVLLTIEGWRMHIVLNPATQQSVHLPVGIFDGETIPDALLDHIPVR